LEALAIREFFVKFSLSFSDVLKDHFPLISSSISSALLISHGLRMDASLTFIFEDDLYVKFFVDRLRYIRPDVQSTYGVFRKIASAIVGKSFRRHHILSGIVVGYGSFKRLLGGGNIFFYDPRGIRLASAPFTRRFKFVMGFPSLPMEDIHFLRVLGGVPVNVSLKYKSPSSIILLVHNYCDNLWRR